MTTYRIRKHLVIEPRPDPHDPHLVIRKLDGEPEGEANTIAIYPDELTDFLETLTTAMVNLITHHFRTLPEVTP